MNKSKTKEARPVSRKTARNRRRAAWLAAALAVALVGWLVYAPMPWGDGLYRGKSFHVHGGETAPVLDAFQFGSTNVRQAYMAAANNPDLLDQIYCYCLCERPPFNHKSLLSCFTDYHGAG